MFIGELSLALRLDDVSDAVGYDTAAPYEFEDHRGKRHTVPAGFPTDGATFPGWLKYLAHVVQAILIALGVDAATAFVVACLAQSLVGYPIAAAYRHAAVAHDWLYFIGAPKLFADLVFFWLIVTRAQILHAERLLLARAGCRALGASVTAPLVLAWRVVQASVMFVAVVVGGWRAYLAHRRRRNATGIAALLVRE